MINDSIRDNLPLRKEKHKIMEEWEDLRDKLCGLDEAGRGPLAGPVAAGAVILGLDFPLDILGDSKKLTEKARNEALKVIFSQAKAWGIGWVWPQEIDRINILQGSLLAMKKAWEDLVRNFPEYQDFQNCPLGVADGLFCPELPFRVIPLVKADSRVPAVSAASIIAKVARDRWMERYSWVDDRYGFEIHKGYPTVRHREALKVHGLSEIHRKTFKWKDPHQDL